VIGRNSEIASPAARNDGHLFLETFRQLLKRGEAEMLSFKVGYIWETIYLDISTGVTIESDQPYTHFSQHCGSFTH
jgi:hypothetical protein